MKINPIGHLVKTNPIKPNYPHGRVFLSRDIARKKDTMMIVAMSKLHLGARPKALGK